MLSRIYISIIHHKQKPRVTNGNLELKLREDKVVQFPSLRSRLIEEINNMQSGTRPSIPAVHLIWTVQTSRPISHGSNPLNNQWQTQGHGHTENKHQHDPTWMQCKLWHKARTRHFLKGAVCLAINKTDLIIGQCLQKHQQAEPHHKPATLAAVKTNTLALEREVKEKFALSPLNTSGCWWVISLTRTFSLATNWLRKKTKNRTSLLCCCCCCTTQRIYTSNFYHHPFTEIPPNMTANELIIVTSGSIRHRQQLVGQISL